MQRALTNPFVTMYSNQITRHSLLLSGRIYARTLNWFRMEYIVLVVILLAIAGVIEAQVRDTFPTVVMAFTVTLSLLHIALGYYWQARLTRDRAELLQFLTPTVAADMARQLREFHLTKEAAAVLAEFPDAKNLLVDRPLFYSKLLFDDDPVERLHAVRFVLGVDGQGLSDDVDVLNAMYVACLNGPGRFSLGIGAMARRKAIDS